jgi:hypothetical protein
MLVDYCNHDALLSQSWDDHGAIQSILIYGSTSLRDAPESAAALLALRRSRHENEPSAQYALKGSFVASVLCG